MKEYILSGLIFALIAMPSVSALEITEPENYNWFWKHALLGVESPTIKWTDAIQIRHLLHGKSV